MRRAICLCFVLLCLLCRASQSFGQEGEAEVVIPTDNLERETGACPIFYDYGALGDQEEEEGGGGEGKGCTKPKNFESFENLEASRWPFVFLREELTQVLSQASEPDNEDAVKMIKVLDHKIVPRLTPALQSELRDFLPESFERQHVYRSCAIVGNSGALMREEKFGEEIDSHDFVMRFNRAPTKGYEGFVGRKTSMRLFSGEQSIGFDERKEETWTSAHENNSQSPTSSADENGTVMVHLVKSKEELYNLLAYSKAFEEDELFMISPNFMRMASKYFNQDDSDRVVHMLPSLGVIGVYYAMHICNSIDVYGLLGAAESSGVRFRYFDSSFDKPRFSEVEQAQQTFLFQLHDSPTIKVRVKDRCGKECTEGLVGCSRCFDMKVPELIQFREFTREQREANQRRTSVWEALDESWNAIKQARVHAIGRNTHSRRHHNRGSEGLNDPTASNSSSKDKRNNNKNSSKKRKKKKLGWEYLIETGRIEECDEEDLKHYLERYELDMPGTSWLEMRLAVLEHFESLHPPRDL